jgi:hydroxymethylbilane synthase
VTTPRDIILATRQSPLALAQTKMVAERLRSLRPDFNPQLLKIVTTGDQRTDWSLEAKGGKGLFTSELEQALVEGRADLAIHSSKDLPSDMAEGVELVGCLPRADPRDVLVLREGVETPASIATGSPRRRLQLMKLFPEARFGEIRGNVETRLRKIAEGEADATVLAAAGLARLGIESWPKTQFRPLSLEESVPAVGQAAIAIQARSVDVDRYRGLFDETTLVAINFERAFLQALGGGCRVAYALHYADGRAYLFHESVGFRVWELSPLEVAANPRETAERLMIEAGLS